MKALVTGANGFLGRHVVCALLARGIEVRAMVRPAARLEGLDWPSSVEVFRADLRTTRDLPRAFEGVDVLLHLAAVVSGGEDAQFAGTVARHRTFVVRSDGRLLPANGWCCAALFQSTTTARSAGPYTRIRRFTRRRTSTPAMATRSPNGGKSA